MNAMLPFPDLSPEIFSFTLFGMTVALRWYALAYIAGILIGWRIVVRAIERPSLWAGNTPVMTKQQVEDLLFWVILGVILGGRLGYVLFYQPSYYLSNPAQILRIWEGGMSFHGGALGDFCRHRVYQEAWHQHNFHRRCHLSGSRTWPVSGPTGEFHQRRALGPPDRPAVGRGLSDRGGAGLSQYRDDLRAAPFTIVRSPA